MNPTFTPRDVGWIEVVTGCMFSGKTEELIRRVRRAQFARQPVVVFKPALDDRYGVEDVGSHVGRRLRSFRIHQVAEIPPLVRDAVVVGIDEAQFFGEELVPVCDQLADAGHRVIVAGLDLDYRGEPFGPMPRLLCRAEYVQKFLAICVVCGNPADRSQRIIDREAQVLVGETDAYEARCRLHWDPENFEPGQEPLPFGPNLAEQGAPI